MNDIKRTFEKNVEKFPSPSDEVKKRWISLKLALKENFKNVFAWEDLGEFSFQTGEYISALYYFFYAKDICLNDEEKCFGYKKDHLNYTNECLDVTLKNIYEMADSKISPKNTICILQRVAEFFPDDSCLTTKISKKIKEYNHPFFFNRNSILKLLEKCVDRKKIRYLLDLCRLKDELNLINEKKEIIYFIKKMVACEKNNIILGRMGEILKG